MLLCSFFSSLDSDFSWSGPPVYSGIISRAARPSNLIEKYPLVSSRKSSLKELTHLSIITLGSPAQGIIFAGASAARATEGSRDTVNPLPWTCIKLEEIVTVEVKICLKERYSLTGPVKIGLGHPMFFHSALFVVPLAFSFRARICNFAESFTYLMNCHLFKVSETFHPSAVFCLSNISQIFTIYHQRIIIISQQTSL